LANKIIHFDLDPDSDPFNIIEKFFDDIFLTIPESVMELRKKGNESCRLYFDAVQKLSLDPRDDFFPNCIKLLEALRDMKDPKIVDK
jgi:hypothetical protein